MARPPFRDISYSFGPGPVSPAIKLLIIVNVSAFLLSLAVPEVIVSLGFQPEAIVERLAVWRFVTYMFLHGDLMHLLFNMLSLWMFGTELERSWRTRFFTKYYFVTGAGAAFITFLWSLSSLPYAESIYYSIVIGASGAVYGVLLAYGLTFPHRSIYLYFVFPIQAKYFVMIVGAIAFLSSIGSSGSGVAHTAHLGGLIVGYLYLTALRRRPLDELRYRWLRWKMNRARSKFGIYSGGRDDDNWKNDWKKHIH
jgi:membrane associated rhomboid family serine protease